jgi:hypothetical protein
MQKCVVRLTRILSLKTSNYLAAFYFVRMSCKKKRNEKNDAGHRHSLAVLPLLPVARYGADGFQGFSLFPVGKPKGFSVTAYKINIKSSYLHNIT